VGAPLADIDWVATALRSPVVIPGITTEQRVWGTSTGEAPATEPVDLDLYVDSSGSMPDPRHQLSYLTLAGAIVALSALRSGASVQATLWSGPGQAVSTDGFVRDEEAVLRVITDFFGGSTSFPVPRLARTYERRRPEDPPVHILHISDEGIDTLFTAGSGSFDGGAVAARALARAGAGGTMVLNLWRPADEIESLAPALAQGWDVHRVSDWAELEVFARAFARRVWAGAEAVS
jgi:hypothetical protein